MTGVGATQAVTGTYVGTAGLVGVEGGVTTGGGGNTGGVWVIGDTTLIGLCGLGVTRGGGILTGGEEEDLGMSSVGLVGADGGGGETSSLSDRGGGAAFGGEIVERTVLGGIWTGLSGGTGSGRTGTVFATAVAGGAPPPEKKKHSHGFRQQPQRQVAHFHPAPEVPAGPRLTGPEEWLGGPRPALLVQVTRNLKVPPGGRSVTL